MPTITSGRRAGITTASSQSTGGTPRYIVDGPTGDVVTAYRRPVAGAPRRVWRAPDGALMRGTRIIRPGPDRSPQT
jgi:hypothetical protein